MSPWGAGLVGGVGCWVLAGLLARRYSNATNRGRHESTCRENPDAPAKTTACRHCGRQIRNSGLAAHERSCTKRPTNRPATRPAATVAATTSAAGTVSRNPVTVSDALVDCPDGCGWRGKAEAVPLHRQSHTPSPIGKLPVNEDRARDAAGKAVGRSVR